MLYKWRICLCLIILICSGRSAFAMLNLDELTLEEKVGQLLIVHFNGQQANAEAQKLIEQAHVGGFIYYNWANGLESPEQVQALSIGLQKLARNQLRPIPLLISVDQEGGGVARLRRGFVVFPSNRALAETQQLLFAEMSAFETGRQLRAVGIHMNFAPVVDVNCNPKNPVIGIRSFGGDPEIVRQFAQRCLLGYKRAGVIAVLKHFPGHGDVTADSHECLPIVRKSRAQLAQVELAPFKYLASGADVIMTGHLVVPAYDPHNCATLSPILVQGLLQNSLGFEGIVITDSLVMQGLLQSCGSVEEAAIRSIEAGHDLILLGGKQLLNTQTGYELSTSDILHIHEALLAAVKQGRISESRLNVSVQKILKLKEAYQVDRLPQAIDLANLVNTEAQQKLAQKIAHAAVRVVQQTIPLPLQGKKIGVLIPSNLREEIERVTWAKEKDLRIQFFEAWNLIDADQFSHLVEWADHLIIFAYNSWKFPEAIQEINRLIGQKKSLIILATKDPEDASLWEEHGDVVLCTFDPNYVSLQVAVDCLMDP